MHFHAEHGNESKSMSIRRSGFVTPAGTFGKTTGQQITSHISQATNSRYNFGIPSIPHSTKGLSLIFGDSLYVPFG